MPIQVDKQGLTHDIDSAGDSGGTWNYLTRHLPKSVFQTFGEALTPSLSPVGGEMNAQDYIMRHLQNRGGESMPEALLKGAAEGATKMFVPRSGIDLQAAAVGAGAGEALGAARGLAGAGKAASTVARQGASQKLQGAARSGSRVDKPGAVSTGKVAPGYHTQRMTRKAQFEKGMGKDPGPRPSPQTLESYSEQGQLKIADRAQKQPYGEAKLGPLHDRNLAAVQSPGAVKAVANRPAGRAADQAMSGDPAQRQLAEQYFYNRARNAPVDVEGTIARNAPTPTPTPPSGSAPVMGTPGDLADLVQAEESARAAQQQKDLFSKLYSDQPGGTFGGGGSSFLEYMQGLLSRGQISQEEFLSLMRAKASEMGMVNAQGGNIF